MNLIVEATAHCNLRCIFCDNPHLKREKGNMTLKDFVKLIKTNDFENVTFGYNGEPLLNKDITKMIKEAKKRGIKTHLTSNGQLLKEKALDLCKSGLDRIVVDMETTNPKTYSTIRLGGDLNRVKDGIKLLAQQKNHPYITISMVKTSLNENDEEKVIALSKELGADEVIIKRPIEQWGQTKKILPKKRRAGFKPCDFLKDDIVVLWNGKIELCCIDLNGEYTFKNLKQISAKKFLESKEGKQAREAILQRKFKICQNCVGKMDDPKIIKLKPIPRILQKLAELKKRFDNKN